MDNNLDCYDSNTARLQTVYTLMGRTFNFFIKLTVSAYAHMRMRVDMLGQFRANFKFIKNLKLTCGLAGGFWDGV